MAKQGLGKARAAIMRAAGREMGRGLPYRRRLAVMLALAGYGKAARAAWARRDTRAQRRAREARLAARVFGYIRREEG